jgi:hypothetical protein
MDPDSPPLICFSYMAASALKLSLQDDGGDGGGIS